MPKYNTVHDIFPYLYLFRRNPITQSSTLHVLSKLYRRIRLEELLSAKILYFMINITRSNCWNLLFPKVAIDKTWNKSEFSICVERAQWKCRAAILLHSCPFAINDLRIARLCIPFLFQIFDCRHLRAEYRSVMIDRSKDACWPRNFRSHASSMYCLSATVSVTVVEYYLCMKPQEYSFCPLCF